MTVHLADLDGNCFGRLTMVAKWVKNLPIKNKAIGTCLNPDGDRIFSPKSLVAVSTQALSGLGH